MDQRMNFYTVHTKSPRWTVNAFAFILDTARVNSQTIYSLKNNNDPRKVSSVSYGWNLVKALCNPQIEKRKAQTCGLASDTIVKINFMLQQERVQEAVSEVQQPHENRKKRRCHECVKLVYGQGYTQNRPKVKQSTKQCQECHKYTCEQHLNKLCVGCYSKRPNN